MPLGSEIMTIPSLGLVSASNSWVQKMDIKLDCHGPTFCWFHRSLVNCGGDLAVMSAVRARGRAGAGHDVPA